MRQPSKKRTFDYFLSQPHQPFFLFGILWAAAGMILFWASYGGALPHFTLDSTLFHAYIMIFSVFSRFFHGFLFTTFPRFCMTPPLPTPFYLRTWGLYEAGTSFFVVGALFFAPLAWFGAALQFIGHLLAVTGLWHVYKAGASPDKRDPFWLLTAHGVGLAAHLLFLAGMGANAAGLGLKWLPYAAALGSWGYLVFLTFVVAQRMVPFFSHVNGDKPPRFVATVFAGLVLKGLAEAAAWHAIEGTLAVALGVYIGRTVWRWKLPFFNAPAILWVLHLALAWLPAALLLDGLGALAKIWLEGPQLFGGLHLALLGFVTTMLIGFGTRVTLGHSGQVPHADRFSVALFWGVQLTVLARYGFSVAAAAGGDALWLFDLSAALWIAIFTLWGWRFGPTLLFGAKR